MVDTATSQNRSEGQEVIPKAPSDRSRQIPAIMTSPMGSYMWDVEIQQKNRFVFLQERDVEANARH